MPLEWCSHEKEYFPDTEFFDKDGTKMHKPSDGGQSHPAEGGHKKLRVLPRRRSTARRSKR